VTDTASVLTEDPAIREQRSAAGILRALGPAAILIVAVEIVLSVALTARFSSSHLKDVVHDAGLWAPLLFVALMALLVPFNVPGLIFVVPSTSLFGSVNGILLSLVGGFCASAIGILGARHLGRRRFEKRLPEWLRSWQGQLGRSAFWTIALLRAVTFLLQPVDWACGLSRVPTRTVLAATFVGLIPPTIAIALTGAGLVDLLA
jgi:uncharacterized membrane protein YdjX (TVP38/TMEM64 family)